MFYDKWFIDSYLVVSLNRTYIKRYISGRSKNFFLSLSLATTEINIFIRMPFTVFFFSFSKKYLCFAPSVIFMILFFFFSCFISLPLRPYFTNILIYSFPSHGYRAFSCYFSFTFFHFCYYYISFFFLSFLHFFVEHISLGCSFFVSFFIFFYLSLFLILFSLSLYQRLSF